MDRFLFWNISATPVEEKVSFYWTGERAAVLVVFALLLLPIIAFLALAIDSSRLASSQTQQGNTADSVALKAQETYVSTVGAGSDADIHRAKLEAVFLQAELIAARLENSLVVERELEQVRGGGPYFEDKSGFLPARTNLNPSFGYIWPGRWWFEEPGVGCAAYVVAGTPDPGETCPCNTQTTNAWEGQCFEGNFPAGTDTDASAFEVYFKRRQDAPIQTVFASVLGQTQANISSRVWVTMIPRLITFVVDLSRSMNYQTHFSTEAALSWGQGHRTENNTQFTDPQLLYGRTGESEYAYALDSTVAASRCNSPVDQTNKCLDPISYACLFLEKGTLDSRWNGDSVGEQPASGSPRLQSRSDRLSYPLTEGLHYPNYYHCSAHFKDEYQCICVDLNEPPDGCDEHYLVDTDGMIGTARAAHECTYASDFTQPYTIETYKGPEPLTTILAGINQALETMEGRLISGDGVGVIFIDNGVELIRTFPRPGNGLARVGDPTFLKLLRITNTDVNDPQYRVDLLERLQSFIFPRTRKVPNPIPAQPDIIRGADTNMINGLVEAYRMLTESSADSIGNRMIAFFGDGLGNCSQNPPGSFDPNTPTNFLSYTLGTLSVVGPDVCIPANPSNNYNNHVIAMRQATSFLMGPPNGDYPLPVGLKSLQEQKVGFNMFLVGDAVMPHSLVLKGPQGEGCYTDGGARANNHAFTDSEPNDLTAEAQYNLIGQPGNFYLQPNSMLYDAAVATSGLWAPIRPACAYTGVGNCSTGALVDELNAQCDSSGGSVGDPVAASWMGGATEQPYNTPGVLACDPYCRSQKQQVEEKIKDLFSDNPFILIEAPL